VERQLDFSEAGKAVTKFLASRNRRIFSMSTENALLTLLREGVSVQEASVDSKRDLEDALRSSCNDFIEHSSVKLATPLFGFVDSLKSTAAVASSFSHKGKGNAVTLLSKDHAFMKEKSVSNMIEKTKEMFQVQIIIIKDKMAAYLESAAAQSILFKPVIRKISRALEELKYFITDVEECESSGWNEITKGEVLSKLQELDNLLKEPKIIIFQLS
jgi:hypothetical protein